MSIKPRQFTDKDGNTIYVNMSKKDYKAELKKQKEAYEAAKKAGKLDEFRAGTWTPENYKATEFKNNSIFEGRKADLRNNQSAIKRSDEEIAALKDFEGSSLDIGNGDMKKDYKALQKKYEQDLKNAYTAQGMVAKRAEQIAKAEAKELVESEKAADEVLSAVYFTPDQKDDYKAQKKALEAQGKHAVLLTEDDMKRMAQLFPGGGNTSRFVTENNGKRVINENDQIELKKAAAGLVGDDNKLSYDERFDLTRVAKGLNTYEADDGNHKDSAGQEGKAISHGSARITKNFLKHLGFDHAHDYTETLIVAGTTAMIAAPVVGSAVVGGSAGAAGTIGGTAGIIGGLDPIAAVAGTTLKALGWALGGTGAAAAGASLIHPKDKTVPQATIKAEDTPPEAIIPDNSPVVTPPAPSPLPNPPDIDTTPTPKQPKLRGRAVDEGLANRKGGFVEDSWKDSIKSDYEENNSKMNVNLKSQFTIADQDDEIEITGVDANAPDTITLKDDTNRKDGVYNTHTYRKLTAEEISNKKVDGKPIALVGQGPFYVLESVTNPNGESIKANTIEVYALKIETETVDNQEYKNYDLRQEKGMTGYGRSSIDYTKRAK